MYNRTNKDSFFSITLTIKITILGRKRHINYNSKLASLLLKKGIIKVSMFPFHFICLRRRGHTWHHFVLQIIAYGTSRMQH